MPKRKDPPPSPKEQFKRFLETAEEKEVDADAAGDAFRKGAGKKAPPPKKG